MNDHAPLVLTDFRGTFDRGEDEAIPPGYFKSSQNVRFINKGVKTREGSTLDITISSCWRTAVYERIGEAKRLLILDGSGNLYDSTNLLTPILSIAAMTDFSSVTLFDRAYITPHDGVTGLPGEKVYVYEGSGTARPAAGVAPSAFTLGATDSMVSGNVEAGDRVIGVAYQTISGFVTAPGGYVTVTNAGGFKLDISAIPIGPSGTVARVLVATKILVDFDGDFNHQTYYFIPNGTVEDNTSTTATVDFYDADLEDDSSYLLEQLDIIPAGVGISGSAGYMAVWGEDANPSVVRVSKLGEPESINAVDGFVTVAPGDAGGGLTNCCEYRGQIVMFKAARAYTVTPTADPPANWNLISIEGSVGTSPHGMARTLDRGESVEDQLFLASQSGFRAFSGSFSIATILSNVIDDIWGRINPDYFHRIEVALDPINFVVYIAVPLDEATRPSHLLVMDYSEGVSEDTVKWTTWTFPHEPTTVIAEVVAKIVTLKFGSEDGNIYAMGNALLTDSGTAIDNYVEFPPFPAGDNDANINNFTGCRLRIRGSGAVAVSGKGADDSATFNGESVTITTSPGRSYFSGFNFNNETCAIKLRLNNVTGYFLMTRFTLYASELWGDRPRS